MKGKHSESLSLRLFNNGKDAKMEKENKGVSHTSFEVQRKKILATNQGALWNVHKLSIRLNTLNRNCVLL